MRLFALIVLLCSATVASAQTLEVGPFLQHASSTEMWVVWVVEGTSETRVEWGLDEALGQARAGSAHDTLGGRQVFEARLTDLSPGTLYHYRVVAGATESPVYTFRTPLEPSAEVQTRLVAMSDMQIDWGNPSVFAEIVRDGVLAVVAAEQGDLSLSEAVTMVLVPGDLVDDGRVYSQWRDHFFGPAQPLIGFVPVYPVPGNHEQDSAFFFDFFHLPENGTPGLEEHWWYADHSNVRIIGLDSNGVYRLPTQLEWLDGVLDDACDDPWIDFVFAQLHHPYLSELWLDGETDFTGEVISRLEQFTTTCGKPSIHFFGHTHGYSRGQSRDHAHLWVNVATAGGNIDYWGEYAQADYEEFTVSQDEWGFVMVDVSAGDHPELRLRRFSRGDETEALDNAVRDVVTIRADNVAPSTPTARAPTGDGVNPDCVWLVASPFSDIDSSGPQAAHWQVSRSCDDFSAPLVDRWVQSENWYDGRDLQADDDMRDTLLSPLEPDSRFCWRVRYRDSDLAWSEWSPPAPFATGSSPWSENLLVNPGAEDGIEGWEITAGIVESLTEGQCDGGAPFEGERYFAIGGVCDSAAYGEARQSVDLDGLDSVDAASWGARFGGYAADWNGSDRPDMQIRFLASDGAELGASDWLGVTSPQWTRLQTEMPIPPATERVEVVLTGTRNAGTDNDSYFDALFVQVSSTGLGACLPPDLPPDPPADDPEPAPDQPGDAGSSGDAQSDAVVPSGDADTTGDLGPTSGDEAADQGGISDDGGAPEPSPPAQGTTATTDATTDDGCGCAAGLGASSSSAASVSFAGRFTLILGLAVAFVGLVMRRRRNWR